MAEDKGNAMSQSPKAQFKHIGLFRIRSEAHRDLILAQCSSWFFVRRSPDTNTEYVAMSDQFAEARPGQEVPLYEWDIYNGRAMARRIPAL
jgi:hypothetical protein